MKIKTFVYAIKYEWSDEIYYAVYSQENQHSGVFIGNYEIDIEEPTRADVINGTVSQLRRRQQEVRAEAQSKVTEIEHEIGKLLAIENKAK